MMRAPESMEELLLAWLHPTAIAKRLVHKGFEDDTDKDKLTAEQVASLVSDPNYVGLDITLKEPISKKTRARIQKNPVPGEGAIELGHDTDVFGVVLVEKNGTVRKAVHQVTRAQIAKIYPPSPSLRTLSL